VDSFINAVHATVKRFSLLSLKVIKLWTISCLALLSPEAILLIGTRGHIALVFCHGDRLQTRRQLLIVEARLLTLHVIRTTFSMTF